MSLLTRIDNSIEISCRNNANNSNKNSNNKFTWFGRSRAGEATSFVIPEYKWIFDIGCNLVTWRPQCIFISHTHSDHINALITKLFVSNISNKTKIIEVYFPAPSKTALINYLLAYYALIQDDIIDDSNDEKKENQVLSKITTIDDLESMYRFKLYPTEFNTTIHFPTRNIIIHTIQCVHRKSCMGYSIFEQKNVLKSEYQGLSPKEINQLRKDNITIQELGPLIPIICYLGDTTTEVFERYPNLLQQHTVIAIECTFYSSKHDIERAKYTMHTIWNGLYQYIQLYPNILFVLQHFSLKHTTLEWRLWFNTINKDTGYYNIHPMLSQEDVQKELSSSKQQQQTNNKQKQQQQQSLSCNCFVCKERVIPKDSKKNRGRL